MTTTEDFVGPITCRPGALCERYQAVRKLSEKLIEPLEPEDCIVQSMPDVSPTRWHLAHTTWFFETFVLARAIEGFAPFDPAFQYLFNSYYNTVGKQFPRSNRGLLSRPTLKTVLAYRHAIDRRMAELFSVDDRKLEPLLGVIEIGLNHEQQHQELILTDIKHVFSENPMHPIYRHSARVENLASPPALDWIGHKEGLCRIGYDGDGFAYDNERPRHRVFLESFELANRPVTNGDYIEFLEAGGYRRPEYWLSAGWQAVLDQGWVAPLYWSPFEGAWWNFTLSGFRPVDPAEPVCHVSYFEADAFARWSGHRLPTETEWEIAAREAPIEGNLLETEILHPAPAKPSEGGPTQLFGDVWEWTQSPYSPYPGYAPPVGALGEYNGKFMCNQFVLRGGSCATSAGHIRPTYRNFFPPESRWQFSGVRLAR